MGKPFGVPNISLKILLWMRNIMLACKYPLHIHLAQTSWNVHERQTFQSVFAWIFTAYW